MITAANVIQVYSGKKGCMCGCKGKYSISSAHYRTVAKNRGYPIDIANEINDRMVTKVVNLLNANPNTKIEDGIAHVLVGGRQYAAYTTEYL